MIQHNENINLIIPFTLSSEIKINLSNKSKIMYYMVDENSIDILHFRSLKKKEDVLNHIINIKNNICCYNEVCEQNLRNITHIKNKIIPFFYKDNNEYIEINNYLFKDTLLNIIEYFLI